MSHTKERRIMAVARGRAEYLQRRIETMQEELDRIQNLPLEPQGISDGTCVIHWEARYPGGTRTYTYAAVKAGDNLWYTTGPRSPKGYVWDDLILWIMKEARPIDGYLWVATEFEAEPLP